MKPNFSSNRINRIMLFPFLFIVIIVHFCLVPSFAEITTDGTVGKAGAVTGPNYAITPDLGKQMGANLFHSFGIFNVNTGESAAFSGPNSVQNIIGRVTGGQSSWIDGTLKSTISGANLYLFNPYGIGFGKNAALDLNGSFHVSTADYLKLGEGGRFDARNPAQSVLTSAAPEAFGFLTANPAGIKLEESFLKVPEGKTISLVGGDVTMHDSVLFAQGGKVNIGSAASSGEFKLSADGIEANNMEKMGNIAITRDVDFKKINENYIYVDIGVSSIEDGHNSGGVCIRGGRFELKSGYIGSDNQGENKGGGIDIQVQEDIVVDNKAGIKNGGVIGTSALSKGDAGDIKLSSKNISLNNGAMIASITTGSGNGGNIDIKTSDLKMENTASILTMTTKGSTGKGGSVNIEAKNMSLNTGAYIDVETQGVSKAGDLTVIASDSISISGRSGIYSFTSGSGNGGNIDIKTSDLKMENSGTIQSMTTKGSTGKGGSINVEAKNMSLNTGAWVYASTQGGGKAGDLTVIASDSISISGKDKTSGIYSFTSGSGNGGNIDIKTSDLKMENSGTIQSMTTKGSTGKGGSINVEAKNMSLNTGAWVYASTQSGGKSGDLTITASDLTIQKNGIILGNTQGEGAGPDIIVNANNILLKERGSIQANTSEKSTGRAPTLTINAKDSIVISGDTTYKEIMEQKIVPSSIYLYNTSNSKNTGKLDINTSNLSIIKGGTINGSTYNGQGSDITIHAADSIFIGGLWVDNNSYYLSQLISYSMGDGNAGSIHLITPNLTVAEFGDIRATSDHTVYDASLKGGDAGDINIEAKNVELKDGGSIDTSTWGLGKGGNINISATESVFITGSNKHIAEMTSSPSSFQVTVNGMQTNIEKSTPSNITSGTNSNGKGGSVSISTPFLTLKDEGKIGAESLGSGDAGEIKIKADNLRLQNGGIYTGSQSSGKGGNIVLDVNTLGMTANSSIKADCKGYNAQAQQFYDQFVELFGFDLSTIGKGDAGNITINAKESITVSEDSHIDSGTNGSGKGGNISIFSPLFTIDTAGWVDASTADITLTDDRKGGDAGSINVNVGNLVLNSGGIITTASAQGIGNAGSITVNAKESISISGKYYDEKYNRNQFYYSGIKGFTKGEGKGGAINIQANNLSLKDEGIINATSESTGEAGAIDIKTSGDIRIFDSSIETKTTISDGGDISISPAGKLYMKNSAITTSVGAEYGNGGNISIKEPEFVILNESKIIAQAFGGKGGNIYIKAKELLKTPGSQIDASSKLGINGNVTIESPISDVAAGLMKNEQSYLDISGMLKDPCAGKTRAAMSSLIMGGRGGMPQTPDDLRYSPSMFYNAK